jgi:peroxiredoxin Q/BCP
MRRSILGSMATSALAAIGSIGSRLPEVGAKAPDFEAASTSGPITLGQYAGRKHVLLAFYYADFTPV